ncbi:MAG: ELMO domain-containing protein, partial [archaeon]|nr:ELMO domain-containing protein [archaeon]
MDAISTSSGSTQSYALQALEIAMGYGFGWESLSKAMVELLVRLIESSNLNCCKSAIQVVTILVENPSYVNMALGALSAPSGHHLPFENLVLLLGNNNEIFLQTRTLNLINTLIQSAPLEDDIRAKFMQTLEKIGINQALQKQVHSNEHPDFVKQLQHYQQIKFSTLAAAPYDKNNADHEALLQALWRTTFPDTALDGRVSQQWKWLGFQGTDPATDFRGMGIVALQHLVYFATNRTLEFRQLVAEQRSRSSNSYPFATAGINLSQMIYELFGVIKTPTRTTPST